MGKRIKKLKNVRLHREGTDTLVYGLTAFVAIALILWFYVDNKIPFWSFVVVFGVIYSIVVNFFRCPKRYFDGETEKVVVAPADGKVVVIEEVFEDEYFHDKRLMISIFMSLFNVHANWFPVDGKVKFVHHQNGNYHKAWLPNERARRRDARDSRRHRSAVPPDSRCGGTTHRNLRQARRRLLHRRASRIYQVRFAR